MTAPAADRRKSASSGRNPSRQERSAAELRANLGRRKAQARARAKIDDPGAAVEALDGQSGTE